MANPITFHVNSTSPIIPVQIMDIEGHWVTVPMIVDWGNQQTLISNMTAMRLGWDIHGDTSHSVAGVFGEPQTVGVSEDVYMRIGNSRPIKTNIIMANTDMDLLGWNIIYHYFDVTLKNGELTLEQKQDSEDFVDVDGGYVGDVFGNISSTYMGEDEEDSF